eukprot:3636235-Amphidinium_carterae.1
MARCMLTVSVVTPSAECRSLGHCSVYLASGSSAEGVIHCGPSTERACGLSTGAADGFAEPALGDRLWALTAL